MRAPTECRDRAQHVRKPRDWPRCRACGRAVGRRPRCTRVPRLRCLGAARRCFVSQGIGLARALPPRGNRACAAAASGVVPSLVMAPLETSVPLSVKWGPRGKGTVSQCGLGLSWRAGDQLAVSLRRQPAGDQVSLSMVESRRGVWASRGSPVGGPCFSHSLLG